ncbi:MAG: prefoldin subunit alpha [Candidatus Helarchaeota archaeon]
MSIDDLNKMVVQVKFLEEQIERLQSQLQLIETSIFNLESTNVTIENIKTVKEGEDILIPIGNTSFLKGKVTDTKGLIINLGADIFADVTIEKAKENIDSRIDDLRKAQQSVGSRLQQFINQMNELRPKLQELYARIQSQQQGGPPPAS